MDIDKYENALKQVENQLLIDSNNAKFWETKGFILDELKRYDEAICAYQEALKLDPKLFRAWYNLGRD